MVRSPFNYYGAKVSMAPTIVRALPERPNFLEACCGGASVFYARPRSTGIEMISDVNPWPVAIHTAVRDHPLELLAALPQELSVADWRDAVIDIRKERLSGDAVTDATAAIIAYQSSWDHSPYHANSSARERAKWAKWAKDGEIEQRVLAAHERLRGVRIECVDALDALGRLDDLPGWLVFCDPPYMKMEDGGGSRGGAYSGYGRHDPDGEWHARFLDVVLVQAARGAAIVLTSGDDPLYHQMLPTGGFQVLGGRNLDSETSRPGDGGEAKPRHLIWSNALL